MPPSDPPSPSVSAVGMLRKKTARAPTASDRMCIASNGTLKMPLSAEDVCFCGSESGCDGGMLPDAWEYIQSTGVVTGAQQTGDKANDDPFATAGFCSRFSLPHCHHHGPTVRCCGQQYPVACTRYCMHCTRYCALRTWALPQSVLLPFGTRPHCLPFGTFGTRPHCPDGSMTRRMSYMAPGR